MDRSKMAVDRVQDGGYQGKGRGIRAREGYRNQAVSYGRGKQGKQRSIEQFLQSQNELRISQFKQSMRMLPQLLTIQFQDKSKYFGQVVDQGIRSGIGIFQTQEGDMYLGDWQNDTYHGYGMYIYHDGERYQGQLVQGLKQGTGKYYYIDGKMYDGAWYDDQREGRGVQRDTVLSTQYRGQWKSDKKQGYGQVFIISVNGMMPDQGDPPLLDGTWLNNQFVSGLINSQLYQGQFHNQTLQGQGTYKFRDGSVYVGQFSNNLFHGLGTYYYSNGDVYEGIFLCGLKSGYGVYKYFTGDLYQGSYSKDLKSGQGKFLFINGNYYVGEFQRDSFHGKGKYFFNKQEAISGWWQNGQLFKGDNGQGIGTNRNKSILINKIQQQKKNETARDQTRGRSPLQYSSPLPQFQTSTNKDPSNSRLQNSTPRHINNFNRVQKASMISVDPSRSPIMNSKFMEVHTPSDSYFRQNSTILANKNKNIQNQNIQTGPYYQSQGLSRTRKIDNSQLRAGDQQEQHYRKDQQKGQIQRQRQQHKGRNYHNKYEAESVRDLKSIDKKPQYVQHNNLFSLLSTTKNESSIRNFSVQLQQDQSNQKLQGAQQLSKKNKRKLQYK